jgi:hypothetical protein
MKNNHKYKRLAKNKTQGGSDEPTRARKIPNMIISEYHQNPKLNKKVKNNHHKTQSGKKRQ